MKIAITGSQGFVGSRLKKTLLSSGNQIVEIDLELGHDLTNWDSVSDIEDFDVLIHLAAKSFVPDSFQKPKEFYETNVISTLNALELCRKRNSKIIYTSSYVYGNPQYLPIDEDHPTVAFNPYGQSKLIGEQLCQGYHRDFNIPVIIFRPFNIYGEGQNSNFLIPKIISQAKKGEITLEDSRPKRDFIYIEDVVDAYEKAVSYEDSTLEVFNLGSGSSISIKEVAQVIVESIDTNASVSFTEKRRKNEVLNTVASVEKTKRLLNWAPKYDFSKGIKKTIESS